jgi:hypothetical protein
MDIQKADTAVVFIDPQNDVLSEKGANWGAVGASVTENRTVENMERIFNAAKANGYEVFISPHYFYPTDSGRKMNGPLEADEFRTRSFARSGPLNLTGFSNSGADWLDRFKRYIEDGKTIVVSPHKMWGRRPTIWSCNCANGGSVRSSSVGCWRTCASNPICASSTSRASRLQWSRTQPLDLGIRYGATAIKRQSSITNFSHMPCCRPTKPSMACVNDARLATCAHCRPTWAPASARMIA